MYDIKETQLSLQYDWAMEGLNFVVTKSHIDTC